MSGPTFKLAAMRCSPDHLRDRVRHYSPQSAEYQQARIAMPAEPLETFENRADEFGRTLSVEPVQKVGLYVYVGGTISRVQANDRSRSSPVRSFPELGLSMLEALHDPSELDKALKFVDAFLTPPQGGGGNELASIVMEAIEENGTLKYTYREMTKSQIEMLGNMSPFSTHAMVAYLVGKEVLLP